MGVLVIEGKLSYFIICRYSVTKKALGEGQDVNFFDFFWCFPNYCIKMNGKMPRERGKVTKLVFWTTLPRYVHDGTLLTGHATFCLLAVCLLARGFT